MVLHQAQVAQVAMASAVKVELAATQLAAMAALADQPAKHSAAVQTIIPKKT
jgi:hypothetical protein